MAGVGRVAGHAGHAPTSISVTTPFRQSTRSEAPHALAYEHLPSIGHGSPTFAGSSFGHAPLQ